MPDDQKAEDPRVVEARKRVDDFQKEYSALCEKYKCNHRAVLKASEDGILPRFMIVVASLDENPQEQGEPVAAEPEINVEEPSGNPDSK